ncbi:hypothetical protein Q765_03665 [Flavobacterium rivuli WB 3.3-2 = DSM 21788]|uniref:Uncharacterized protein n=1 Tax=Flavobacterium rivuli WB 3.3-2 = DSM 21788 TaxID=1121895 RepID=A0A0A2M6A9_9FLAO|nr:hypothetical protein [Flavobacterium rivuli]KGO88157.1 hypothetical protein Q765_03665 [Flavobacterium rivuli WB 3.3-2 = DSM 21788]
MASDYQLKKESFGSLVEQIRVDNMEYFRGKTMSRVYMIGKSNDDLPALLFPKNDMPNDIKEKLNEAFKSIFLDAE